MANRYFKWMWRSLETEVKSVFAHVTFGATGAPTLDTVNSKGVLSVTRNSAGVFTFVFGTNSGPTGNAAQDTYVKVLGIKHLFDESVTGSAPAAPGMYMSANNIATHGTASIQLTFNAAGTATDPASTEGVYVTFIFGDSTAP